MKLKRLSLCSTGAMVILAGVVLIGCKAGQSTPAAPRSLGDTYTSQTLTISYTNALNASNQLMLGMLRLEGTENAITAEQAATLLPVAQAFQGQALKSDAERNAAWAYIETHLTPAQSSAIADMHLTQDDLQTWTRDAGPGAGFGPGQGGASLQGTPGAAPGQGGVRPQGTLGAGQGQGGFRPQGTPSARQGQGGFRPQGTPGARPSFGGPAGSVGAMSGQSNMLLNALIRLLAQKSGVAAPSSGNRTMNPPPSAPRTAASTAQATQPTTVLTPTPSPTAQPIAASTVTATATLTATAAKRATPLSTQSAASGAPLKLTQDDIEYAPSAPSAGERKIQLTIRLKPKGGTAPFSLLLDGAIRVDGLTYTFDWHNCGQSEPHSVVVLSADGQKSKPVEFIYPYECP
jgi:hypothetical protein